VPDGRARTVRSTVARFGCFNLRGEIAATVPLPLYARHTLTFGDTTTIEIAVGLNGLRPEDVTVELVLTRGLRDASERQQRYELVAGEALPQSNEQRFSLDLRPELCGRLDYRIRMYPRHALLTHPFELGLMRWL